MTERPSPATDAAGARHLLDVAIAAAHGAGELVLGFFDGSEHAALWRDADAKSSPTDLVTRADRASEAFIVDRLLGARPLDGVVGEEGSSRQGTSGIEWIVDPIDGTTNFLYRYPAFSISIAACDANGALVGVVHDPLRRETFTAMRGGGSFCNGQPIPGPRVVPPLSEALIATGFGYSPRLRANQAEILGRVLPGIRDIRRGGSAALDLCSVAVGRVDAYYEAGLGRWDREAGVLVATEAGRVIRDHPGIIDDEVTLVVAPPGLIGPLCALLEAARGG